MNQLFAPEALSSRFPLARTRDLITQNLEDELLIYDCRINKALSLNKVSKFVWENCDGSNDLSALAEKIGRSLSHPITEEAIWMAIDQLKKEDLMESVGEESTRFDGISRRELIRKVGLTSAVALPMICAIIAPSAAHAQSIGLLANGTSCSANSECSSNKCQGVCCSSISNPGANAPGYFFGAASCRTTDAACQTDWGAACCSGKASLSTINGLCFFPGEFQCECDPYNQAST